MDPGEVHVDPVHDEFFKMQDLADALVRESVQNSLDARRPRATVRVRFRFGVGPDALSSEAARHYFQGLREHLDAVSDSIHSAIPAEDESVPYLLIEDFGTRGLTGDPNIDPELESDAGTKNDFFYFWRNVGRSSKGEVDRGRWGLGKAVFTVASRIRTIFGLTRRAHDKRALLLGQSVLKTHILDGTRIYPYGFFARFEKRNGLPLPIEDPMLLERFADDFQLHRVEPGLSVVVPYFRSDELSFERIAGSAIRQYFYPILRGELVVDVESGGVRKERIDSTTIDRLAPLYVGDAAGDIERLCLLTRWSLEITDAERLELPLPNDRAAKWSEDIIPADRLQQLREMLEAGERIAVRVPLLVKRKKAKAAASWFDVYLEKDDSLRRGETHFIRRGITIPDVRSTAPMDKPVRALIVIDDDALSTFLGDAENPAHSDWSERADKLRTSYDLHAATLRFVKNSAAFLSSLLSRPPQGRARDFLQEIFSIDLPADEQTEGPEPRRVIQKANRGESAIGSRDAGGAAAARSVTIAKIAGGFTIRGSGDESVVARPMFAELGYRARTGNPFRKHSAFDFDLTNGDIGVDADGTAVRAVSANRIEFTPASARFQITMKGFDVRRDLVIRVAPVSDDAPETQLH